MLRTGANGRLKPGSSWHRQGRRSALARRAALQDAFPAVAGLDRLLKDVEILVHVEAVIAGQPTAGMRIQRGSPVGGDAVPGVDAVAGVAGVGEGLASSVAFRTTVPKASTKMRVRCCRNAKSGLHRRFWLRHQPVILFS